MDDRAPMPFMPFRRNVDSRIYYSRGLPHLRQVGATYFVTFRAADSMPSCFRDEWVEKRNLWLEQSEAGIEANGGLSEQESADSLGEVLDCFLDKEAGDCLLRRSDVAGTVEDSLRFYDGVQMALGDFVIMLNHVHALITPMPEYELEKLLGVITGFSAKRIKEITGAGGSFWESGFYDHLVRTGASLRRVQDYI